MIALLSRFTIAALAVAFSSAATAQLPVIDGYNRAREANQLETLRTLQQLQMLQQIQQRQQQQERQRQDQRWEDQQRQSQMEEIQAKARKVLADRSKGVCVELFLKEPSASEELSRRGTTIGQLCSCVEQEMFSMLTLDLSGQILVAINESAGDNLRFVSSPAGKEYLNRHASASNVCVRQLVKAQ